MNINSRKEIAKIDKENVLGSVEAFSMQCEHAWSEASRIDFPNDYKKVDNIVVPGMGGSRFTPRTIKELYWDRLRIPYEFFGDYHLPNYVNEKSLVILSSYSGNTEEPVNCISEIFERKAKASGVTTGGKVAEFLESKNLPGYIFEPKFNPSKQPRVGSGYMLMGHLGLLKSLDLLDVEDEEVNDAITYSKNFGKKCDVDVLEDENPAKKLAKQIIGKHVFVITAEFLQGFGNGMANQVNETMKQISDPRFIPELNHHMMEGLKEPSSLKENGLFLFFESELYSERIKKRFEITKKVIEKQGIEAVTIRLTAETKLGQVLEAYTLSGFATLYGAVMYDTDPAPIPWVDYFKEQLGQPLGK